MANTKPKEGEIRQGKDILSKYQTGGNWKRRKFEKRNKGSQTPGNKKRSDTCQLSPVAGMPRKAFIRSRGYKLRGYGEYCAFFDRVNKQ